MRYLSKSQTVIYRAKMHRVLKRNFEVFPVLDWLAGLIAHMPSQGEPLVRPYGWQSNASRGKRQRSMRRIRCSSCGAERATHLSSASACAQSMDA